MFKMLFFQVAFVSLACLAETPPEGHGKITHKPVNPVAEILPMAQPPNTTQAVEGAKWFDGSYTWQYFWQTSSADAIDLCGDSLPKQSHFEHGIKQGLWQAFGAIPGGYGLSWMLTETKTLFGGIRKAARRVNLMTQDYDPKSVANTVGEFDMALTFCVTMGNSSGWKPSVPITKPTPSEDPYAGKNIYCTIEINGKAVERKWFNGQEDPTISVNINETNFPRVGPGILGSLQKSCNACTDVFGYNEFPRRQDDTYRSSEGTLTCSVTISSCGPVGGPKVDPMVLKHWMRFVRQSKYPCFL